MKNPSLPAFISVQLHLRRLDTETWHHMESSGWLRHRKHYAEFCYADFFYSALVDVQLGELSSRLACFRPRELCIFRCVVHSPLHNRADLHEAEDRIPSVSIKDQRVDTAA